MTSQIAPEIVALGLPDWAGEGPLAGEAVPMPRGSGDTVTVTLDRIEQLRSFQRAEPTTSASTVTWTYHLQHHAIPPRSGNRYHFLVPDDLVRWEQVFITAVRMLVDVDPRVREAVTCRSTLCELTGLGNVVES